MFRVELLVDGDRVLVGTFTTRLGAFSKARRSYLDADHVRVVDRDSRALLWRGDKKNPVTRLAFSPSVT